MFRRRTVVKKNVQTYNVWVVCCRWWGGAGGGEGAVVSALAASNRALDVLAAAKVVVDAWVRRCEGA